VGPVWYDGEGDLGMYQGELGKWTGMGTLMLFDIGVLGCFIFREVRCARLK